jgi:carbonic anhydrase
LDTMGKMFENASSLKPLGQLKPNCPGIIIWRYSKKFGLLMPIRWSYVKTRSCSGSHLGIPINIKHTKFVKDLPRIDAQFRFNQCNNFREENISVFSHMVLC